MIGAGGPATGPQSPGRRCRPAGRSGDVLQVEPNGNALYADNSGLFAKPIHDWVLIRRLGHETIAIPPADCSPTGKRVVS